MLLAGPRFGFARNYFKFVLIGACVHALIRIVTTRNNNYFTFVILPIWHFSGGLSGHLRSKTITKGYSQLEKIVAGKVLFRKHVYSS